MNDLLHKRKEIIRRDRCYQSIIDQNFDAVYSRGDSRAELYVKGWVHRLFRASIKKLLKLSPILPVYKYDMDDFNKHFYGSGDALENVYPIIMPCWDRTPRSGKNAVVYVNSTPEVFRKQIQNCLQIIQNKTEEHKIIFLMSWNEWGKEILLN
jgi:hypothetical protein